MLCSWNRPGSEKHRIPTVHCWRILWAGQGFLLLEEFSKQGSDTSTVFHVSNFCTAVPVAFLTTHLAWKDEVFSDMTWLWSPPSPMLSPCSQEILYPATLLASDSNHSQSVWQSTTAQGLLMLLTHICPKLIRCYKPEHCPCLSVTFLLFASPNAVTFLMLPTNIQLSTPIQAFIPPRNSPTIS